MEINEQFISQISNAVFKASNNDEFQKQIHQKLAALIIYDGLLVYSDFCFNPLEYEPELMKDKIYADLNLLSLIMQKLPLKNIQQAERFVNFTTASRNPRFIAMTLWPSLQENTQFKNIFKPALKAIGRLDETTETILLEQIVHKKDFHYWWYPKHLSAIDILNESKDYTFIIKKLDPENLTDNIILQYLAQKIRHTNNSVLACLDFINRRKYAALLDEIKYLSDEHKQEWKECLDEFLPDDSLVEVIIDNFTQKGQEKNLSSESIYNMVANNWISPKAMLTVVLKCSNDFEYCNEYLLKAICLAVIHFPKERYKALLSLSLGNWGGCVANNIVLHFFCEIIIRQSLLLSGSQPEGVNFTEVALAANAIRSIPSKAYVREEPVSKSLFRDFSHERFGLLVSAMKALKDQQPQLETLFIAALRDIANKFSGLPGKTYIALEACFPEVVNMLIQKQLSNNQTKAFNDLLETYANADDKTALQKLVVYACSLIDNDVVCFTAKMKECGFPVLPSLPQKFQQELEKQYQQQEAETALLNLFK